MTLRNRPFLLYLGAQLLFILAVNLVQPTGPYLATVILGRSEGFAAWMASLGLLRPDGPGGPHDAANLAIVGGSAGVLGLAVAGMLVLPHVLISQLVDAGARRTGAQRAAMYFGVQGLCTKWMYGVGLLLFTFLLSRFGNSPEQPLGVLLVGPLAAGACLVSLLLWTLYPEREILAAARAVPQAPVPRADATPATK